MLLQLVLLAAFAFGGQPSTGLPEGPCEQVVAHRYYTLCYDYEHRQALWTQHELTVASINGQQKRSDDYRRDPNIDEPVGSGDYRGSGYDRGHLVPAADMKLNQHAMSETFYMSNMSPQTPAFNRGIWARLESQVRQWVRDEGNATVVTAPVLVVKLHKIDTGVSIPEQYYKIAYFPEQEVMRAFLLPNQSLKGRHFMEFAVSVDEIEELTGLDFFAHLPDDLESRLEANPVSQLSLPLPLPDDGQRDVVATAGHP